MTTTDVVQGAGVAEERFTAMGCRAHVVVVGGDPLLARWAVDRIEQLEARWSRFRETSEVSRLNRSGGGPTLVSHDTFTLLERSVQAWELTGGRYDPTVADRVVALGYDRDFREVRRASHPTHATALVGTPGCSSIRLDPYLPAVTLGAGVHIDPGGIGKGLAADLVVAELMERGAAGALVNLGGDLAATGDAPTSAGWVVGVEAPEDRTRHVALVTVRSGGVATSSSLRRAWKLDDGRAVHHLVDPAASGCLDTPLATVTVVAGTGWWAEALTKALFIGGIDDRDAVANMVGAARAHALVVTGDGALVTFGDPGVFAPVDATAATY